MSRGGTRRDRGLGGGHGDTVLRHQIARAGAGLPIDLTELPPAAARAVRLASRIGGPRVPALEAAAAAARDRDELSRAVQVAAAEGRSVARALVLAPPVVGPVTALFVSDAPLAVWSTHLGRVVLLLAVVLWMAGGLAVHVLVRRAVAPRDRATAGPSDELLDLVAIALTAGAGLPQALRHAGRLTGSGDCVRVALWLELGALGPPPPGWEEVGAVLAAARRDGVPLAGLVGALAAEHRRAAHHMALQRAARLGARLTLPTTLLLLPAAGLVAAAPLLHGVLVALG